MFNTVSLPSISLFIFFRPANYSADGFGHGILRSFAEFCKERTFGAEAARSFIELRPQLNFLLFSSQPRLFFGGSTAEKSHLLTKSLKNVAFFLHTAIRNLRQFITVKLSVGEKEVFRLVV